MKRPAEKTMSNRRNGEMAKWRNGEMAKWRNGEKESVAAEKAKAP